MEQESTALQPRWVWELIAASFFVDIVAMVLVHQRVDSDFAVLLVFAIIGSQTGLMGIWLGVGEPYLRPERLAGCTAFVFFLWAGFLGFVRFNDSWPFMLILGGLVLMVAAGLLVARTCGVRLRNIHDTGSHGGVGLPAFQFSLRQLFIWTTVAAMVAAVLGYLGPRESVGLLMILLPMSIFASLTWIAVWAVLGRKTGWRLLVLFLVPFGVTMVIVGLSGMRGEHALTPGFMLIGHTLITAASLAVFRANGYRMTRARAMAIPLPTAPAPQIAGE